jgi:hypothetical protein
MIAKKPKTPVKAKKPTKAKVIKAPKKPKLVEMDFWKAAAPVENFGYDLGAVRAIVDMLIDRAIVDLTGDTSVLELVSREISRVEEGLIEAGDNIRAMGRI